MAIAAVTRDLRSFANTMVVLLVLYFVALLTLFGRLQSSPGLPAAGSGLHATALQVGPLALLVFVYWMRDRVTLARAVGASFLVAWFLLKPFMIVPDLPAAGKPAATATGDAPQIGVDFDRAASGATLGRIQLRVTGAPWRDATRLIVTVDSLLVHARDGSTVRPRNRMSPFVVAVRSIAADSRPWRDFAPDGPTPILLAESEVQALASGVASVEIVGRVDAYSANAAAVMPFESGRTSRSHGVLLQLDSVQRNADGATAVVTTITVRSEGLDEAEFLRRVRFARRAWLLPRFVLLDDSTHQAIRVAYPSTGMSDGWMVLPGTKRTREWTSLQTPTDYIALSAGGHVRPVHFMHLDWELAGSARLRTRSPVR